MNLNHNTQTSAKAERFGPHSSDRSSRKGSSSSEKRPERRAQPRRVVDTSVTILLVKSGSKLSGRIADLSPAGCRICCDDRFPVGIYTRVETEFRLQGLPFRLGGVVQAVHDRRTIGIRFLDMSPRKREQVESLIAEMQQGD